MFPLIALSALGGVGSVVGYFGSTTQNDRDKHKFTASVMMENTVDFFKREKHPILNNVKVTLVTKNDILVYNDMLWPLAWYIGDHLQRNKAIDLKQVLTMTDANSQPYFNIDTGAVKEAVSIELWVEFYHPHGTKNLYEITLVDYFYFPFVVEKKMISPKRKTIATAVLLHNDKEIDITDIVVKLAGYDHNYYSHIADYVKKLTLFDVLAHCDENWCEPMPSLIVTDLFSGEKFEYGIKNPVLTWTLFIPRPIVK